MNDFYYNLAAFLATMLLVFSLAIPVHADPGRPIDANQTVPGDTPTPAPDQIAENPEQLSALPIITVWNKSSLRFGHIGNPQNQINIPGNVRDTDGTISSLTYRLNNGSSISLARGPNGNRLENAGDFNVAINISSLNDGPNRVIITARDNNNDVQTETVDFTYVDGQVWPSRYSTNWATANNIYDQAQIVDGFWRLVSGGVRPTQVGYDRLIAIGDMSWTEYEVLVPITTHGFYPDPDNPNDAGGVGILARWTGHTGTGSLPSNWWDMGAYAYYSNRLNALALRLDDSEVLTQNFNFQLNRTYMFKLRVETNGGQGVYSFKIWEQGQPEPSWNSSAFSNIVNVVDATDARLNGSILLVAHRTDATFGNVTVCPPSVTYPLSVSISGGGSVNRTPSKTNYQCGEGVTLTAVPDEGWTFTGWTGGISSSSSTISFNMTQAQNLTANFRFSQAGQLDEQTYIPMIIQK